MSRSKRCTWEDTTGVLLRLLDDHLQDILAGGIRRGNACKDIAAELHLRTGQKYTAAQVQPKLIHLSEQTKGCKTFPQFLEQRSAAVNDRLAPGRGRTTTEASLNEIEDPKDLYRSRSSADDTPGFHLEAKPTTNRRSRRGQGKPRERCERGWPAANTVLPNIVEEDQASSHITSDKAAHSEQKRSDNQSSTTAVFDVARSRLPTLGDLDVADRMSHIGIQNTAYSYCKDSTFDNHRAPDFGYIEQFPDLSNLLKIAFGVSADDGLAKIVANVRDIDFFNALIASGVLEWVFRSQFPEIFVPDLSGWRGGEHLERARIRRGGRQTVQNVLDEANHTLIHDPNFQDREIRKGAISLANRMANVLKPLIPPDDPNGIYYFADSGYPKKTWEKWQDHLQRVFKESLNLKAELSLKKGEHRFFWPVPNAGEDVMFDRKRMNHEQVEVGERPMLLGTSLPGIECIPVAEDRRFSSDADGCAEVNARIISKAQVVVRV